MTNCCLQWCQQASDVGNCPEKELPLVAQTIGVGRIRCMRVSLLLPFLSQSTLYLLSSLCISLDSPARREREQHEYHFKVLDNFAAHRFSFNTYFQISKVTCGR